MAKKKPSKTKIKTLKDLQAFETSEGRGNVDQGEVRKLRREIKKNK